MNRFLICKISGSITTDFSDALEIKRGINRFARSVLTSMEPSVPECLQTNTACVVSHLIDSSMRIKEVISTPSGVQEGIHITWNGSVTYAISDTSESKTSQRTYKSHIDNWITVEEIQQSTVADLTVEFKQVDQVTPIHLTMSGVVILNPGFEPHRLKSLCDSSFNNSSQSTSGLKFIKRMFRFQKSK